MFIISAYFHLFSAYFRLFPLISAYFHLFPFISAYFCLFPLISAYLIFHVFRKHVLHQFSANLTFLFFFIVIFMFDEFRS